MTSCDQGDIVLIPFPFTDFATFKRRPAVILSSNRFNQSQRDVILAAITSHLPPRIPPSDYLLSATDLRSGGLPKASLVKLGKIVTIDQRLVRKQLGSLSASTVANLPAQFQKIFSA